jgi:hypothetical protein
MAVSESQGYGNVGVGMFAQSPYARSSMQYLGPSASWQLGEQFRGQMAQQKLAETGIQPAMQANQMKQDRFNQIFPWLTGQAFGMGPQLARAGGQSGPGPSITVGGVWNPEQIQQQVNATRAQNDQSMQTQNRAAASDLAARGFGSNSPLLAALQGQNFASNLGANTQAEQQLRTTAAQQNAQQTLATQQAAEGQYHNRMQEEIARLQPYWSYQSALIGALAGLV